MEDPADFIYEPDATQPLSTEVVTAVAQAHEEDVIDQMWRIGDDINTDALNGLFQDNRLDTTLQFEADSTTVTIIADTSGNPVIKVESHR
jgi:CTP:molybdopterin cytidylyltransferase MocA